MLNSLKLFFIGVLFLTADSANAHKFYMSICDMEYNEESKSLQIVMKFFVDDLEEVLERETGDPIFLGTEKENWKTDEFIQAYMNNHFFITQRNKKLASHYVGKEVDKDYTWVYIEVKNFDPKKEAELTNSLLTDYFEDQTNKVNYKYKQETNSFTLHKYLTSHKF